MQQFLVELPCSASCEQQQQEQTSLLEPHFHLLCSVQRATGLVDKSALCSEGVILMAHHHLVRIFKM